MSRILPPAVIPTLLAAVGLAAAVPTGAQHDNRVLVRTGAEGRFQMLVDRPDTLAGHADSSVREFGAQLETVITLVRALPAVSDPPPPRCTRLDSWISRDDIRPFLSGSVGVQIPELTGDGQCADRSEMSVRIGVNQFEPFLPPAHTISSESAAHDWYVLEPRRMAPGVIELQSGAILYFDVQRPPFLAVSNEAYAHYQLDQITNGGEHDGGELGALYRARLADWSPSQRAAPACIPDPTVIPSSLSDMVIEAIADCPARRKVVKIDPDYFDLSRPGAIQLISLANPPRASLESEGSWQLRSMIWEQIDHETMRALVERP